LTVSEEITFRNIETLDDAGSHTEAVEFLHPMRVRLTFEARVPLQQITFYIGLHTSDFIYLTANNTAYEPVDLDKGIHSVILEFKAMTLLPGVYCVLAWIGTAVGRTVFHAENLSTFRVFARDYIVTRQRDRALFQMEGTWTLPSGPGSMVGAAGLMATG